MKKVTQVAEIKISYKPTIAEKPMITKSADAFQLVKTLFDESTIHLQEQFVVMYLNIANKVIGGLKLSQGGITGTVADPRLILGVALKSAATGIILAHNHPSGNLKASRQDEVLTQKIKEAGIMMDINLLDHIILGMDNDYLSMADEGLI